MRGLYGGEEVEGELEHGGERGGVRWMQREGCAWD
jgi:hypothetical protein